jgi:DNA-binding MarR family transcriptional regulator
MMKMNDIAEKIGRDKSTLTVLINKLSRLKYVKRVKSKDDSRSTYIVLTQKAIDLKPEFERIADLMIDTAFQNFSKKEKDLLMDKLEKLYNNY